jgi:predicted AAA+ superfamily ATPase
LCFNLNLVEFPLKGNSDYDDFKVYFNDTGLLLSTFENDAQQQILTNDMHVYKGAIYENFLACTLYSNLNYLYFYKKKYSLKFVKQNDGKYIKVKTKTDIELDFITVMNNKITAIECKANNKKPISLINFLNVNKEIQGVKLGLCNVGVTDNILILPIYMLFLV